MKTNPSDLIKSDESNWEQDESDMYPNPIHYLWFLTIPWSGTYETDMQKYQSPIDDHRFDESNPIPYIKDWSECAKILPT